MLWEQYLWYDSNFTYFKIEKNKYRLHINFNDKFFKLYHYILECFIF